MDRDVAILFTEMLAAGELRQELCGKSNYSYVMKGAGQGHAGNRDPDSSCSDLAWQKPGKLMQPKACWGAAHEKQKENSELRGGADPGTAHWPHHAQTSCYLECLTFIFYFKNHPFEI